MKNGLITCLLISVFVFAAGCGSKASDEEINKMCRNYLKITGVLKGSDEKKEVARVIKERTAEKNALKEEMERDLKGQDDVLTLALKTLDEEEALKKAEAANQTNEEAAEDKKKGEESDEEAPPEKTLEEKKKDQAAVIEKRKQVVIDQFENLISKIDPRMEKEVERTKGYAAKRKAKLDQAMEDCLAKSRTESICKEMASCRIKANVESNYNACE